MIISQVAKCMQNYVTTHYEVTYSITIYNVLQTLPVVLGFMIHDYVIMLWKNSIFLWIFITIKLIWHFPDCS